MARDRTGIKSLGNGRFLVRVNRKEARTGLVTNRKQTVRGTADDALRVRDALRAELESTADKRPRTRLRDYLASWLERRASNREIRDTTIRKYGYTITNVLAAPLGDIFVDALTREDVKAYIAARVAAVGIKGGNTVLNELRMLRTVAKDTIAEGYAESDWCARIKPPKVRKYSKERPNRHTPASARAVLAHVPAQWKGITMLIITTGLRWGEASALHWDLIDRATLEATIKFGNDRGRIAELKTDSSYRTVPILPEVYALFGVPRDRGLVFPTRRGPRKGQAIRGWPLVNVMKRACKAAGVAYVTPHGLRRTFNNLARQSSSREVVKAITGHATDEMMEHYSHVELDEKQAAARAVATAIDATSDVKAGRRDRAARAASKARRRDAQRARVQSPGPGEPGSEIPDAPTSVEETATSVSSETAPPSVPSPSFNEPGKEGK